MFKKKVNVKNKNDNIVFGDKTADDKFFKFKKSRPKKKLVKLFNFNAFIENVKV